MSKFFKWCFGLILFSIATITLTANSIQVYTFLQENNVTKGVYTFLKDHNIIEGVHTFLQDLNLIKNKLISNTPKAPPKKQVPLPAEGKKPGKAILVAATSEHDYVGTKTFNPDKKLDACLQVAFGVSDAEIMGVRIDTLGRGTRGRWQNNISTGGMPLLVVHNGSALNAQGGNITIKSDKAGTLDLFLQDNGSVAAGKDKLRITLILSNEERSYALFDPAAQ